MGIAGYQRLFCRDALGVPGIALPDETNFLVTFCEVGRRMKCHHFLEGIRHLPRRPSATLTEAELRLMNVLWDNGSCTVQQVLDGLPGDTSMAYNSVLTTIRILERKGYLRHNKDGRAYVYSAVVQRADATRSEVRHLVKRFFQDSHELLVLNVLEDRNIDAEELKRLRELLGEYEKGTDAQ